MEGYGGTVKIDGMGQSGERWGEAWIIMDWLQQGERWGGDERDMGQGERHRHHRILNHPHHSSPLALDCICYAPAGLPPPFAGMSTDAPPTAGSPDRQYVRPQCASNRVRCPTADLPASSSEAHPPMSNPPMSNHSLKRSRDQLPYLHFGNHSDRPCHHRSWKLAWPDPTFPTFPTLSNNFFYTPPPFV